MCNKVVGTYSSPIQFVPKWFKSQEMYDNAFDTCPFVFDSVSGGYKIQEIYDKVVSKEPFMLKYCPDRYETQKMCNKAVTYLLALKFVPDWFLKTKITWECCIF